MLLAAEGLEVVAVVEQGDGELAAMLPEIVVGWSPAIPSSWRDRLLAQALADVVGGISITPDGRQGAVVRFEEAIDESILRVVRHLAARRECASVHATLERLGSTSVEVAVPAAEE